MESWTQTLSTRGYDVLAVSGIINGVERAREGGIDVVVLDSYDGAGGVAELVAELDRLPDAPPVILVSGSSKGPQLSVHIGAAGFLTKPCEPEDLAAAVQRVANVVVRQPKRVDDEPTGPVPREED
jgi:DNA-binding NtrC family response regulator